MTRKVKGKKNNAKRKKKGICAIMIEAWCGFSPDIALRDNTSAERLGE